ncbi:Ubiquitin carboxyl-terminal hydrolase 2-like [Oopsacas minuta]|uniref:ubiquitinyl hydrolase 1 n=1 Tax=Oopsacas minuta TaxID=111878 RepID=A0AAV7KNJ5_9METZ|nr:Ubiquitin carboxyl-terminal hydrolase 2-like [Oopsacas minuta]
MNCILQCLSHTLLLKQFFVSDDYKKDLAGRKGNLSYAFKCVMTELWISSKDPYPPYDLKKQVGIVAPRFSGYSQQDAQEFMRFLLNEIHDEINKAELKKRQAPKKNESLKEAFDRYLTWENSKISDLFSGMLRREVCCSACKSKSIVYDPFMDLALPIPKIKNVSQSFTSYSISYDNTTTDCAVKLNDCLQLFTHEETLDDEERPYCNKCKTMTKSTKQLGIERLPSFLVIQLKRFSGYSIRSKLSTPVEFEENWEIQDYNNNTHSYSLYGIACHSGGIYGGHYTAYCKYDKQWRYFNDHYTMLSSWEHVKRQEAYILFYEKNTQ